METHVEYYMLDNGTVAALFPDLEAAGIEGRWCKGFLHNELHAVLLDEFRKYYQPVTPDEKSLSDIMVFMSLNGFIIKD